MTPGAPVRFQRLVLAALVAVVVTLVVADWRVLVSPADVDVLQALAKPTKPRSLSLEPQLESPAIVPAQLKSYEAILERPLFDPSRRPPPAVIVKPAPTPPKPAQAPFPADKLRLVGIMRSPGKPPQALVRTNLNDPGLWIAEGGMVVGWRVERVGEDKVDFSANGATGMLKLIAVQAATDVPNTAATVPAAVPTPAPAPAPPATAPAKK